MNVGDRVTFTNEIGGNSGMERDGQESTVARRADDDYIIRFDDGYQMFVTAAELAALT